MKTLLGILVIALPVLCAAEVVVPIDSVKSHVNIRLSADAKSEIVGRLDQGSSARLLNTQDGWHEVEIVGGATGFISVDWTNVLANAREPAVSEAVEEVAAEDESLPIEAEDAPVAEIEPDAEPAEPMPEPDVVAEAETAAEATTGVAGEAVTEPEAETVSIDEEIVIEAVNAEETPNPAAVAFGVPGETGPEGSPGETGPAGPADLQGDANIKGTADFLVKFKQSTVGGNSQIYDDGNQVGIGTTEPKQRLEVNGNIQIHAQNTSVAGLMITQSSGDTGYIMHNLASTMTIGAGSEDRITIKNDGNIGFGVNRPAHPIDTASGAHLSAGGVWTNSSSRDRKQNIGELSIDEALATLTGLEPVHFNYKDDSEESHVGFIAEDVPSLVATSDRKGLSPMDIVAVLTKVVQAQQQQIERLEARLATTDR